MMTTKPINALSVIKCLVVRIKILQITHKELFMRGYNIYVRFVGKFSTTDVQFETHEITHKENISVP